MFLSLRDSEITIALVLTLYKQWGENKILRKVTCAIASGKVL